MPTQGRMYRPSKGVKIDRRRNSKEDRPSSPWRHKSKGRSTTVVYSTRRRLQSRSNGLSGRTDDALFELTSLLRQPFEFCHVCPSRALGGTGGGKHLRHATGQSVILRGQSPHIALATVHTHQRSHASVCHRLSHRLCWFIHYTFIHRLLLLLLRLRLLHHRRTLRPPHHPRHPSYPCRR